MNRGIIAGSIAIALKVGPKLFAALAALAKGLKVGKVGLAATSLAAYSYLFTWQFALIILLVLYVHERGHIWAMRRCGMKTKGIYFIPLLGAAAVAEEEFPSRLSESFIALMGPIWGLGLSGLAAAVYLVTNEALLAAAASWMAMINLFNLLPINPLDGGRVFKSVAYSIGSGLGLAYLVIGVIAAGIMAHKYGMGLFVFLLVIGTIDLLVEYKKRLAKPKMTSAELLGTVSGYAVVTAVLWGLMVHMEHVPGAAAAMSVLR